MAKELLKFEQFPSIYGPNPGNPYVFREFPKMVYKPSVATSGKITLDESIVNTDVEAQNAYSRGWHPSPEQAMEAGQKEQTSIAAFAANRAFHDRRMSEPARAEVERAEQDFGGHMPELPEAPKRGRRRSE